MSDARTEERIRQVAQRPVGALTLTIYEATSERGPARRFWTLTRQTPAGRERVDAGWREDLRPRLEQRLAALRPEPAPEPVREPTRAVPPEPTPTAEPAAPRPGESPLRAQAQAFREDLERTPTPAAPDREARPRPEPTPPPPQEWWSVVALERLHLNGAEFRTVGCYPHRWEADRMVSRDDSRTLAVWPQPGPEPRGVGERLLAEPHDSPALDRLMRQGRWREETVGEYATFGTWHDREEPPVRGQRVTVEERGLDYRGEPRDHRIQPHVPLPKYDRSAPGDPERTLFVVVRRDAQEPAVWRVDEITFDRNQAVSAALKAEQQERLNRQMNDPKQWPTMSLTL